MPGVAAPGGDTSVSSTLTVGHATTTVGQEALPDKERRECHTISDDGGFVCGLSRGGSGKEAPGLHSRAECIAKGHKHCQACFALEELGLDGRRG
jgi:hypothetical protein